MTSTEITEFWAHFVANHWGKTPVVVRPPAGVLFGTSDETFAAALEAARQYATSADAPRISVYAGENRLVDASPLLPRADDGSLDGYLERATTSSGTHGFGVMMMQFQAMHGAIWDRAAQFLGGLYAAAGRPAGATHLDCFAMNQHRGFNGVHRDVQDVFTTVVAGRKRMLLWPFERLLDYPGVGPEHRRSRHSLGQICEGELRADAVVLDAEPGDLMYWPADYWHVSEADGTPVVTLGLGVIRTADPVRFAAAATHALLGDEPSTPIPSERGGAGAIEWLQAAMTAAFADARYHHKLEDALVRWLSGFGFERHLPLQRAVPVDDDSWLTGAGPHGFFHRVRGHSISIAAHGHSLALPAHPALVQLCEQIARGVTFRIGAFLDDSVARERPDSSAAIRDKLRALLGLLARTRVLAATAAPTYAVAA